MPIGRCVTVIIACGFSTADYPFVVGDISDEDHLGRDDVLQNDRGGRSDRWNFPDSWDQTG